MVLRAGVSVHNLREGTFLAEKKTFSKYLWDYFHWKVIFSFVCLLMKNRVNYFTNNITRNSIHMNPSPITLVPACRSPRSASSGSSCPSAAAGSTQRSRAGVKRLFFRLYSCCVPVKVTVIAMIIESLKGQGEVKINQFP